MALELQRKRRNSAQSGDSSSSMGKLREMIVDLKLSFPASTRKGQKYEKSFACCRAGSRHVGGSAICPSTGKDLPDSAGLRESLQRFVYLRKAVLLL